MDGVYLIHPTPSQLDLDPSAQAGGPLALRKTDVDPSMFNIRPGPRPIGRAHIGTIGNNVSFFE